MQQQNISFNNRTTKFTYMWSLLIPYSVMKMSFVPGSTAWFIEWRPGFSYKFNNKIICLCIFSHENWHDPWLLYF